MFSSLSLFLNIPNNSRARRLHLLCQVGSTFFVGVGLHFYGVDEDTPQKSKFGEISIGHVRRFAFNGYPHRYGMLEAMAALYATIQTRQE